MKGLVVDEPWVSLILRGEKNWEMRKTACHYRGRIALIRKGTGQVVGVADVDNSLAPLSSPQAYAEAEPRHRIPKDRQDQAFADGWRTPWVLSNAKPLVSPVPYKHPFGAVIWVNLDKDVIDAVEAQDRSIDAIQISTGLSVVLEQPAKGAERPMIGRIVKLTGGNVRNNHIYVPLDFFPPDAIGGSNRSDLASRMISVTFKPGSTVETDIDGTKRIFRSRGAVADFFARAGIVEGDSVCLNAIGPYAYQVSKAQ